jgi:hypothetical protein
MQIAQKAKRESVVLFSSLTLLGHRISLLWFENTLSIVGVEAPM